jgi:hypothetical protein
MSATALVLRPLPKTEAEMVQALVAHLGKLGDMSAFGVEVRLHGRSRADVCAVIGGDLIAIEVKRTDWRRALGQAALNRFCADRSYIALWSGRVPAAVIEEAARHGIGVLGIGEADLEILGPAPAAKPDPVLRSRLREALLEGSP